MQYTTELLAKHLGSKFDPKATYVIETHAGAASRVMQGTHKSVGEVPDFSLNEKGMMVVLECKHASTPDPSGGSGSSSIAAPTNIPLGQRCVATPVPMEKESKTELSGIGIMPIIGEGKPVPEPEVKTEPIWDKPKITDRAKTPAKKTPAKKTAATDRGGKPLGGKKK
jgi:hypothetical protein